MSNSPHDAVLITEADRDKRIAEAAYYRAEKRGFVPGFALEDWLAAENLVDHEIKNNVLAPHPRNAWPVSEVGNANSDCG